MVRKGGFQLRNTDKALLVEYRMNIAEMEAADLGDKRQASRYNARARRIRCIAGRIEEKYPALKEEFYRLLFSDEGSVRIWAAHHMLEVMHYEGEQRAAALREIRCVAEQDASAQGLGNRMWLREWLKAHPEDERLIATPLSRGW